MSRCIDADALKEAFEEVYPLATNEMGGAVNKRIYDIVDNAPTVESQLEASNYSEGWMDGYNHAIDQIFKELNYLLKNHVIEELRKRIKR